MFQITLELGPRDVVSEPQFSESCLSPDPIVYSLCGCLGSKGHIFSAAVSTFSLKT